MQQNADADLILLFSANDLSSEDNSAEHDFQNNLEKKNKSEDESSLQPSMKNIEIKKKNADQ